MELNKKGRNTYTSEHKEKALKYYLLGLNLFEISKLTDIPERTLQKWQTKERWVKFKETDNLKEKAVNLKKAGIANKQISEILKISTTTVWRYCKKQIL